MERVREAIVVEGRHDKNAVKRAVDALVVETRGFGVFSDAELRSFIGRLARARGVIVLTDGDGAGFLIRNRLRGEIRDGLVKHAYIPDIPGRERRKRRPSREGKLGVEAMPPEVIVEALRRCGAVFEGEDSRAAPRAEITKTDLYLAGLSGGENSAFLRRRLAVSLGLPERIGANALTEAVNALFGREEFYAALSALR